MIATDEDALVCDLAETYHVLNYRTLPCYRVAVLACGLRNNARIKMKMTEDRIPLETMLSAMAADYLALLVWMNSEEGRKGINRPKSIVQLLQMNDESENGVESFETAEEFEERRQEIMEGGNEHGYRACTGICADITDY